MSHFSSGAHRAELVCPIIKRAFPRGVSPGTPDEPGCHRALIGQPRSCDLPWGPGPEPFDRAQARAGDNRHVELRPYQHACLSALEEAVAAGQSSLGVMPTGSGKSMVIAALAARVAEAGKRTLMLTHVRELIEQDASAFARYAPSIEHGIFCRGLGRFELEAPVVFAQTQSLHARKHLLDAPFDVVIVDEAHLIPFSGEGRYTTLIRLLRELQPGMPLIGLTATPFRLRGGYLHQGPDAWFDGIAYEIGVAELIEAGYLAPLTGKKPRFATIDPSGLRIERGDYRETDLAALVDDDDLNRRIVGEIVRCAAGRRAWLVFAVGIDHAIVLRSLLEERGIAAGVVLGNTPKTERDALIQSFRSGRLRALINVNVLTTGFDASELDLLAVARPTASTSLHVQMLGRGTRVAAGKTDCLVLDFAGNCQRLGPITAASFRTTDRSELVKGEQATLKVCPRCDSYLKRDACRCEHCGHDCPAPIRKIEARLEECSPLVAHPVPVEAVVYAAHRKPGRPASLRIAYKLRGGCWLSEWLALFHGGIAGRLARKEWRARGGGDVPETIEAAVGAARVRLCQPAAVRVVTQGAFVKPVPVWSSTAASGRPGGKRKGEGNAGG